MCSQYRWYTLINFTSIHFVWENVFVHSFNGTDGQIVRPTLSFRMPKIVFLSRFPFCLFSHLISFFFCCSTQKNLTKEMWKIIDNEKISYFHIIYFMFIIYFCVTKKNCEIFQTPHRSTHVQNRTPNFRYNS